MVGRSSGAGGGALQGQRPWPPPSLGPTSPGRLTLGPWLRMGLRTSRGSARGGLGIGMSCRVARQTLKHGDVRPQGGQSERGRRSPLRGWGIRAADTLFSVRSRSGTTSPFCFGVCRVRSVLVMEMLW